MPAYDVTIPDWTCGASLTVEGVPADTPEEAYAEVLEFVNSRCAPGQTKYEQLPEGTKVRLSFDQPAKETDRA